MERSGRGSVLTVSVAGGVALLELSGANDRGVTMVDEWLLTTLAQTIDALDADDQVVGAVLASADRSTFLAGSDVESLLAHRERAEVAAVLERGHGVLRRIETWRKPLVVAVEGACLGGGTELALAASGVVAADTGRTRFALPEVRLGLLPLLGGCVRLPRRVGLLKALDIIVSGRDVYADEALASGIVTQVVPPDALRESASQAVQRLTTARGAPRRPFAARLTELVRLPLVLDVVLARARSRAVAVTHGHNPAASRAVEVVGQWARRGRLAGERASIVACTDLLSSRRARALIRLSSARSAARRNPWAAAARPVARLAVVGAGPVGAGIAAASAGSGMVVRIADASPGLALAGRDRVAAALTARVGRGMTRAEANAATARVTAVASREELAGADVTIEAVGEVLDLKRAVLAEVETVNAAGRLFASSTAAIPIGELSAWAARPEAVVGMHYLSPVPAEPLVEVVVTRHTEEWAVATATAVGLAQGNSVIVVLDGPGFYTTRVRCVYLAEALLTLGEGVAPSVLERAAVAAGFPAGPLESLDDVGIDTSAALEALLEPLLVQRGYAPGSRGSSCARLAKAGFLGRERRKGFYLYEDATRTAQFDVRAFLTAGLPLPRDGHGEWPTRDLAQRLLLAFVREAVLCLHDGVLRSPRDGDVGAVLGIGFPAHLGGPFGWLDDLGAAEAVGRFESLRSVHGERFAPPALLVDMAATGRRFYPDRSAAAA